MALFIITALFSGFGLLLGYAAIRFKVEENPLLDQVESILPQTQCGQCSYPGCRPYAEAIVSGAADINQCPPGGAAGIQALADLLSVEAKSLNTDFGEEKPKAVAVIIEQDCIGCTKCIPACPVDAILGAARHMHTVIAAECTGCELCVAPCPVDCIIMEPIPESIGVQAASHQTVTHDPQAMPCIRCGECVKVCPAQLLPQQLYWHGRAHNLHQAQAHNLFDCTECGYCETVCPSHIPLLHYFRSSKSEILTKHVEKNKAEVAKQRHDAQLERKERARAEYAEQSRKQKAALKNQARASQLKTTTAKS